MSSEKEKTIPLEDAEEEVAIVSRRLALLHLSYAKTLINEFEEEKGKSIILKAIKEYGKRVGEKTREEVLEKGLEPTPENFSEGESLRVPKFGMHEKIEEAEVEGEKRIRAYKCEMGEFWKEEGEEEIGRLYCYVDPAKYISYNPDYKLIHTKTLPDGDELCELVVRPTTDEEKKDFEEDKDWRYIDNSS